MRVIQNKSHRTQLLLESLTSKMLVRNSVNSYLNFLLELLIRAFASFTSYSSWLHFCVTSYSEYLWQTKQFASLLSLFCRPLIFGSSKILLEGKTLTNNCFRILVGLRWWSQLKPDGTEEWIFESFGGDK